MTLRISFDSRGYYVQERFFFFWHIPTSDAGAFTTLNWGIRGYKYFDTLEEAESVVIAFMDSIKSVQTKPVPIYKYTLDKSDCVIVKYHY